MHPSYVVLAASAVASFSSVSAFTGHGTVYGPIQPSGGNCALMSYPEYAVSNYAAINKDQWDDTMNCGRCAVVKCVDSQCVSPSKASEIVYIIDQCPGCENGDLDLSPTVFEAITGLSYTILDIEWEFVTCPMDQKIEYCLKPGSSAYWAAIQPTNMAAGVDSVTIDGKTASMVDSAYFFLLDGDSVATTDLSHVTIQMTSVTGEVIEDVVSFENAECVEETPVPAETSVPPTTETATSVPAATETATSAPATTETATSAPVTETPVPATAETATSVPTTTETATSAPATETSVPAATETTTSVPATETPMPATLETATSAPATETPVPATAETATSAPATETPVPATAETATSAPATEPPVTATADTATSVSATESPVLATAETATSVVAITKIATTEASPTSVETAADESNAAAATTSPPTESSVPADSTTSGGTSESIRTRNTGGSGHAIVVSVLAVLGCLLIAVVLIIALVIKKKKKLNEQLEQEKIPAHGDGCRYSSESDFHTNIAVDQQTVFSYTAVTTPQPEISSSI
ncbi:hypothetical protein PRIC2_014021 [Phytophthora ramorum]